MKLRIRADLDYQLDVPTDVLLQLEAALIPEQIIEQAWIDLSPCEHFARVSGQDGIGERIWLRAHGQLLVTYEAVVTVQRLADDWRMLERVPSHLLTGETVPYLLPSRYCPSDRLWTFAAAEFDGLEHGAQILAMRDWIAEHLHYVPGSSDSATTAADTFITRQGICRDYAHLLITFARSVGIPARIASVYALGVDPPDFHAVAEIFLGGNWHLVDATGMAQDGAMAKIGVGRDAADVAFLTSFGSTTMNAQSVSVEQIG
jgi:transglutaminase-like putative cysteine protease